MSDPFKLSKFLSLVLRHKPDAAGVTLEEGGWCEVAALISGAQRAGFRGLTLQDLRDVVAGSDKQRFAMSDDGLKIRANQGHSVAVEMDFRVSVPPELLYHGTVARFLPSIREQGLRRMARHHVHLSADEGTARIVGARRGEPVVLVVRAGAMARTGIEFFISANGVWLVEAVAPEWLEIPGV